MSTERRVLVTGAGGFIGRWSVPPLLRAGYEVHAIANRTPGALPAELRGTQVHAVDLLDAAAVDGLLNALRPSHLLHFAWIATPGVYWTSADNLRWLAASERLLHVFRANGGVRAVMAGSCAEYDWSAADVCDERASALAGGAITLYAQCKIALQRALTEFGRERGVSTAWGRIFFQYGPHEHPDRLVASVMIHLLAGREAPCSHGRQIRSFLHVADVGAAFAALLDSAVEGPVNIGSAESITIADLVHGIARRVGRSDLVRLGARSAPPAEPAVLLPALHRLHGEVGWRPAFDLAEGIADTLDWWRRTVI